MIYIKEISNVKEL